jgi:hypothetical protein
MDYKEFYYWLNGFMTNRDWTVIREIDIETIQEKLKEVKSDGIDVNKIINLRKEVHIPINTEIPNPFKDND